MANNTSRIMVVLIVVAGGLALGMAQYPEWFTGRSTNPYAASMRLVAHPSERCEVTKRRIHAKSEIIKQLLRNEIGLIEAGQQFAHHNNFPKGMEERTWRWQPGRDDGEKMCRQVILWADAEIISRCSASEREMILARFEQELATHLTRHGTIRLDVAH